MKKHRFWCECADSDYYFRFNKRYDPEEVEKMLKERIFHLRPHILPGLVLRDENGQLLVPDLRIVLKPKE